MADSPARVLVFDSGLGAISIGTEIHRLMPQLDIIHAMDCEGFPYGDWEEEALSTRICQLIAKLESEFAPTLIVVACNSASTVMLPALRQQTETDVVGVVPAIKPAAAQSQSGVVGLLATPATIKRDYTEQLIAEFAADCQVLRVGSAALAPAVERLYWEGEEDPALWGRVMEGFRQHPGVERMDTVVLACTHFPLVREQLAAAWPGLIWVDSGAAIARRVQQLLAERVPAPGESEGRQLALIIGPRQPTHALQARLREHGIQHFQCLDNFQLGREQSCEQG